MWFVRKPRRRQAARLEPPVRDVAYHPPSCASDGITSVRGTDIAIETIKVNGKVKERNAERRTPNSERRTRTFRCKRFPVRNRNSEFGVRRSVFAVYFPCHPP